MGKYGEHTVMDMHNGCNDTYYGQSSGWWCTYPLKHMSSSIGIYWDDDIPN